MSNKQQCKECGCDIDKATTEGTQKGDGIICGCCKKTICLGCFGDHAFYERCFVYETVKATKEVNDK